MPQEIILSPPPNTRAELDSRLEEFYEKSSIQEKLFILGLKQFCERIFRAWEIGQKDNSSLYAGSPMFFYCQYCGLESDRLPESYVGSPSCICQDCNKVKPWLPAFAVFANQIGMYPPTPESKGPPPLSDLLAQQ